MSDDKTRLAEIAARLNAATPGEWEWQHLLSGSGDGKIHSVTGDYIGEAWHERDGLFIAHAPGDIRWLLDYIERLANAYNP